MQLAKRLNAWWSAQPDVTFTSWIVLRSVGVVYLLAFVSLWTQIIGLIGRDGILPVGAFLSAVSQQVGPQRVWLLPTLCWIASSDLALHLWCALGTLCSLLLILDVVPALAAAGAWAVYLSLTHACQVFLGFQWDALLLEAGFLAIWLASLSWRPSHRTPTPAPRLIVWLLRWLVFRLMFASGMVKLLSGDPTWRNLTALAYHYETQPIPAWTSWYMHQLPAGVQRVSTAVTFIAELIVPWLIVGPQPVRRMACGILIGFQLLLLATGNYAFFNWLAVALCLALLDDADWPARLRAWWQRRAAPGGRPPERRWPPAVIRPIAGAVFLLSLVPMSRFVGWRPSPTSWLVGAYDVAAPFGIANSYGLFAVMTTSRPEIIVEGSRDGIEWRPYEFRYKAGDLARRPRFVAPHQPRLDWQMWFAALGSWRQNPWFIRFCEQLLDGSPAVLRLLARNPFPDGPPRYVRATLYDYHFTTPSERRATGRWWRRDLTGAYCPILSR